MGTTTNRALRYPEGTVLSNTLHTQIKNLADDVDAQLHNAGWIVPVLQSGFSNLDATQFETFAICKVNGWVNWRGMLQGGTRTSGTLIFTLPVNYRPGGVATDLVTHTPVVSGEDVAGGARLNIGRNSGLVRVNAIGSSWVSLNNISYPAFA